MNVHRPLASILTLFVLAFVLRNPLHAQDVSSVTGVVTDATGAVIPGASVTLSNATTGVSYKAVANSVGSYRIVNVPPGPGYRESFSAPGFSATEISDIYLNVGTTRTQDAKLRAGENQQVDVSASSQNVTINTTDASVGNNFDVQLVNELPVQNRDSPAALFTLQPGVTLSGSTTGARVDQNNVTLDGLDVNDFATGSAFAVVGKAPVDSVQEFRGTTGGFPVNSGPGGGGQFQLVTKSGTNQFHGLLNEYHRDTSTVANDWFNNNSTPVVARPALIRNQFGGNLGGPILRDKLFFFFDFNESRIIQNAQVHRTVPLDSFRNGTLSYIRNKDAATGATCTGASRQNTTPNCIGSLNAAQVAALDPQHIGFDTAFLASVFSRFPHANDLTGGDGINTGYFRFNAPTPDYETNYVGKVDYTITPKMKLFARFSIVRENGTESAFQFPGDPATSPVIDRSYAVVLGHNWQIGTNKVNDIYLGETVSQLSFPNTYNPQGTNVLTFGDGTTTLLSDAYTSPINAQGRRIPIPVLGDDFSWQKGSHTISLGGTFKDIDSHSFTKLDYNTITIGLGGNTLGLTSSLRPADIRTAGTTASNTYDSAFAFALGRIGSIGSAYNYNNAGVALPQGTGDIRKYRYYQTELYAGDTWKVTPSLTLSYGVNYQIFSVPYELQGLESVEPLTFNQYFSARVAQSAAGKTGNSTVPLITYVLGGKANNGPSFYQPSYKDIAPRFAFAYNPSFDRKTVFNGGAGVVYDRTVVNAVQYQQDQHSYLFQQSNTTPFGVLNMPVQSLATDPRLLANNALPPAAAVQPPPAIKAPYQPFVDPVNGPYGLVNGNAFNTIIDPALKTPYSIEYNAGVQHEFVGGFVMKLNYVGRLGRRLLAQADANQIIDFTDPKSGQLLSSAFANVTTQLRAGANSANLPAQPFFEDLVAPGIGVANGYPNNTSFLADNLGGIPANGDFADFVQAISGLTPPNLGMAAQFSENTFYTNKGFSTYNGLLATLQKNLTHGLQFDVNYTWAHSIDNVSLIANQGASAGYGFVCDVLRPRLCRGNSDFDTTHYISADFTYQLPFGRGRQFVSNIPRWLNEAVGGWDISGISQYHSGVAFGTVSNAFVAGYSNDAPATFIGTNRAVIDAHPHKIPAGQVGAGSVNLFSSGPSAANLYTGPVGFNIGSRNDLRGPRFVNQNFGLAKNFPIVGDKVNLKFRADAFNALNHPSFSNPVNLTANDITSGSFGQITSTASTARVIQLALRLEF